MVRVDYNLSDTTGNVAAWDIAFYHNNPVGAPVQTTDQNGNVSWTGQTDPFGNVQTINPNITQNLRFPGQYFDQEWKTAFNICHPICVEFSSQEIGVRNNINDSG
ncbi:MAG: RHS domain-containing protein [Methylobacter sp.]